MENEGINPSNCQKQGRMLQNKQPEFLGATLLEADGPIPAAVRNVPAETDAPMLLLPEEMAKSPVTM